MVDAIVIGDKTVDRIVNGKYEWRDAGLSLRKKTRTGVMEEGEYDPG